MTGGIRSDPPAAASAPASRRRRGRFAGCGRQRLPALALVLASGADAAAAAWFEDVAAELGVDFRHRDGRNGSKYYVETTASGGGWLDYDGDGDLDLYLVNGAATPGSQLEETPRNALYENRDGRFFEVTGEAGVGDDGFGMGLCVGDVDADGRLDLLVTNFGPNRLYLSRGRDANGRVSFTEIAGSAGVADPRWSIGCGFGDLDGDGDLDLYVSQYLDFAYDRNPECRDPTTGVRLYCRPDDFRGVPDALYVNQGAAADGRVRFREEGAARGIAQEVSEKGMGVLLGDLDLDGDLDIYVANDGTPNRLYVNDGRGRFEDRALLEGAALSGWGSAEASMGVVAGDIDGDGRADLLLTHFAMETHTLYHNLGTLQFEDRTARAGLGRASYKQVGWGVGLFDADNDGDLDLAVANGHMQEGVEQIEPGLAYRQRNQLFENRPEELGGFARFRDTGAEAGPAFALARVSRGLAIGDWNDDGRLDLLITNTNSGVELLENRRRTGNHWLGLELRGPASNRFAIGARVEVQAGPRRHQREVRSGGSFASQSDLRLHVGLGVYSSGVEVDVHWPDGHRQQESTGELDRYWTIHYRAD